MRFVLSKDFFSHCLDFSIKLTGRVLPFKKLCNFGNFLFHHSAQKKKNVFLKSKNSPAFNVGFNPSKSFEKYKHKVSMLSLSNAFNDDDLKNFEKKIFNYLNNNSKIEYSAEPKIDGISASLTYKKKKLVIGVSRGDGNTGEVITENLKKSKIKKMKLVN